MPRWLEEKQHHVTLGLSLATLWLGVLRHHNSSRFSFSSKRTSFERIITEDLHGCSCILQRLGGGGWTVTPDSPVAARPQPPPSQSSPPLPLFPLSLTLHTSIERRLSPTIQPAHLQLNRISHCPEQLNKAAACWILWFMRLGG